MICYLFCFDPTAATTTTTTANQHQAVRLLEEGGEGGGLGPELQTHLLPETRPQVRLLFGKEE